MLPMSCCFIRYNLTKTCDISDVLNRYTGLCIAVTKLTNVIKLLLSEMKFHWFITSYFDFELYNISQFFQAEYNNTIRIFFFK